MRRKKVKRSKGKLAANLWKIGIGILVPLVLLDTFLFIDSNLLKIKTLDIRLNNLRCVSENDIRDESQILGQKLFFLDQKKTEKNLESKFFCIKSINISRSFPDKVRIEVFGREAVAVLSLIYLESSQTATLVNLASQSASISAQERIEGNYLVDKDGIVFSKIDRNDNLPVIYFWGTTLDVGKVVGEGLVNNSLRIIEKIKTFGVETKEAKIFPQDVLLINPITQKPRIVFSLKKIIDIQLASLQLILTQAKIDEEEMEFIDLRYDKPVVKYIQKR